MFDDCLRTRGCLSIMTTRFQRHVHRGSFRGNRTILESVPLRMPFTASLVPSFPDHLSPLHDHGSHHRVRIRESYPSFGKLHRPSHVFNIFLSHHVQNLLKKYPECIHIRGINLYCTNIISITTKYLLYHPDFNRRFQNFTESVPRKGVADYNRR